MNPRTYHERQRARSILHESKSYGTPHPDSAAVDQAKFTLSCPFAFESIEELVEDAIENSMLGGSELDPCGSPGAVVKARLEGLGESVVHVVANGKHRLIVNGVAGEWSPGRQAAWCGNVCVLHDATGEPKIFRAFALTQATTDLLEP